MLQRRGIVWLSSSSAEIVRARHILKALTPGGTIDELGFLVLFVRVYDATLPFEKGLYKGELRTVEDHFYKLLADGVAN